MYFHVLFSLINISYACATYLQAPPASSCQPFTSNFGNPSSVADSPSSAAPFVAISPGGTYATENGILELFLQKPPGMVTRHGRVNDKVADGATVNSTFSFLHGKVTFEVAAPAVAGVVTAVIFIADHCQSVRDSANQLAGEICDEIDVELLGGDPKHWQTNVFAPSPQDPNPHYGVLNSVETLPPPSSFGQTPSIVEYHKYTIDWNAERIVWSVDGNVVRTLTAEETKIGKYLHFPTFPTRLQMGIWDASSPVGTSAWAKGPIDWNMVPDVMSAHVRSVTLECPEP